MNIEKIMISLTIIAGILSLSMIFLTKNETISKTAAEDKRFIKIYEQNSGETLKIYYDKETKVMYLATQIYRGGGLTVLVDKNGKPLLYEEE